MLSYDMLRFISVNDARFVDVLVGMTILTSKYVEFSCASFDICEKFVGDVHLPIRQHKLKRFFSVRFSKEMGSVSVSFIMIFEVLQF